MLIFMHNFHAPHSFIKQYYEMMAKHPENLHKFYNEDSFFLHSDLTHVSAVRFVDFTGLLWIVSHHYPRTSMQITRSVGDLHAIVNSKE